MLRLFISMLFKQVDVFEWLLNKFSLRMNIVPDENWS